MAIIEHANLSSRATLHEDEAPSSNGSAASASPFEVEGHIDKFASGWIEGWAWAPALPGQAVVVEAVMDGRVLAATLAGIYRSDLAAAGKRAITGESLFITTFRNAAPAREHSRLISPRCSSSEVKYV